MAITTLPAAPQRTDTPALYVTKADAMMAALPQLVTDINTTTANITAIASGGAFAIPYTVDLTSTADTDPGNGNIRFNSATQNATTTLRLDLLGSNGSDFTALIDTFDSSSSTVKGTIRLTKLGDTTKFIIFNVLARNVQTGFRDITVTVALSSVTNPFVNGDSVVLFFQRTGDMGQQGTAFTVPTMYVRDEKATNTQGGSASVGVNQRTLNTVKTNSITGASLSGNAILLTGPGTFEYVATAPALQCSTHQVRMYNSTDSVIVDYGTTEFSPSTDNTQTRSIVRGVITISTAVTKTYQLQHYLQGNNSGGAAVLGAAGPTGTGNTEVYAEVWIKKVA